MMLNDPAHCSEREGKHNEHASCWIRVSQGWAGAGWGIMAIPCIGQEVIVDFLKGDPDQLIITGRTYHAANVPLYALPAHKARMSLKSKTHKGSGFNELRFEDEKDKEEVFIHAQKDQNSIVLNNEATRISCNRTENIGKDEQIRIGENLTVKITQASRKKAKSVMIEAADVITLKAGGSSIEQSPSGIVVKATTVDVKGNAMVAVKGGPTKIN